MKSHLRTLAAVFIGLSLTASSARADDVSGKWGVSGIAAAESPLGEQSVKDEAKDVGTDFGGMLSYGISPNWGFGVSYENMNLGNGLRVEPIEGTLLYHFSPESHWSPTLVLGVGAGRGVDTRVYNDLTAKAGLGLDYFITPEFSIGPQVACHYISETAKATHRFADVVTGGLVASLFFGGSTSAPAPAPAPAPAKVEAPPPVVTPSVSVSPAQSILSAGQTQQFSATVSGIATSTVTWSLNPSLGTVSPDGLYTAPTPVAFAEDVMITAVSAADASKSASAVIKLTPPAAAPQEVSIKLNVLFTTGRYFVRPKYHAEIQRVADFMKSYPNTTAEIEGHSDNVGSVASNMRLSQRRADSVRMYLIEQFGIDGARLTAKGYGPSKPIADNNTAAGRAQNRRVVATLTATKN